MLRAMETCFDWGRLVDTTPTAHDYQQFRTLATMLKPYLRTTEWPNEDTFPEVVHVWPSLDALVMQYARLMKRVRTAWKYNPRAYRTWWTCRGFRVVPLVSWSSVDWLVAKVLGGRIAFEPMPRKAQLDNVGQEALRRAIICLVSATISGFLEASPHRWHGDPTALSRHGDSSFFVTAKHLFRVGYPWRNKKKPLRMVSSTRSHWEYRSDLAGFGRLAQLVLSPTAIGRLVYVQTEVKDLDWGGEFQRQSTGILSSHAMAPRGKCQGPCTIAGMLPRSTASVGQWHRQRLVASEWVVPSTACSTPGG